MAKKQSASIANKNTVVAAQIVDDNPIPSPQEIEKYREVDPRFVDFFIDMAKKEQEYRHSIKRQQIEVVENANRREFRINMWGMTFGIFALFVLMGVAVFAIIKDSVWLAGGFGLMAVYYIIKLFVTRKKQ